MSGFLTALVVAVLVLALCADYGRRSAARGACPCGCGNPAPKNNQPRGRA